MFESKINRGRANGYAPLDSGSKISLSYLPDIIGGAGTSGTSGVNGSSGAAGTNGTSGINGTSGTSGSAGSSGTSGLSIVASDFVRIVDVPADNFGSSSNEAGMFAFDYDSIYFATQSYTETTYYVTGYAEGTHVIVPNTAGIPAIQSNGWTITINGTPHSITGAYPPNGGDDYWYLEFDNLENSIYAGTQLMTLVNVGYERPEIWAKIDFGFERDKFVENSITSSIVKRTSVPTSLTGSVGDIGGMIAFDSGAIYLANESYYGAGPYTVSLYQSMENSANFPITKGSSPKPKIGWTVSWQGGVQTATVTNIVEYTNYWLVYTNGGNSSISTPATVTLITNGLLDNVWLKNDFGFERGKFATTGSNSFKGNQTINGSVQFLGDGNINTNNLGVPTSISTWNGQGGWNQGYYSNVTASGGTGTGLTVNVAAGGGGYINIGTISINTPGSGYTNGDIVTINNENNLPGEFTISSVANYSNNWEFGTDGLLTTPGNIILSGSLIQQVNYAASGSGSYTTPATDVTRLDITKDIHLIDITGIETNSHYYLPNGLYDGQVVRFALKGDGTASPNYVFIHMDALRRYDGFTEVDASWSPFYNGGNDTERSLGTAVYIDGAWNVDSPWFNQ